MATPEGKIKAHIKKVLNFLGAYYHMPVLNGMGKPSLDFICCYKGRFFAIEAKAPGKTATVRQQGTIQEIEAAGGAAFVVASAEDMKVVVAWLEKTK